MAAGTANPPGVLATYHGGPSPPARMAQRGGALIDDRHEHVMAGDTH